MMWKQSVVSSSIAASLAAKFMKEGGLLTLPGAQPALQGTAGKLKGENSIVIICCTEGVEILTNCL